MVFSLLLVFSLITLVIPYAEAKQSAGTPLLETGSKSVCGVSLCNEKNDTTFSPITSDVDPYFSPEVSTQEESQESFLLVDKETDESFVPGPLQMGALPLTSGFTIPDWVRNNAEWWATGQISTGDFIQAIQYLIDNNILLVSSSSSNGDNENFQKPLMLLNLEVKVLKKQIANQKSAINELDSNAKYWKEEYEKTYDAYKSWKEAFEKLEGSSQQSIIDKMAQTNPLIKGMINGKITFYIEPVPSYAAPEMNQIVSDISESFQKSYASKIEIKRVFNSQGADLVVQWIKDYGSHTVGQAIFKAHVKIGLGATNCYGDWSPFDKSTVAKIMWHELGHSMGFMHNNIPNNIMYPTTQTRFTEDYVESDFMGDGHYKWIPFCGGGTFQYSVSNDDQYSGFNVYIITPDTDPQEFIENGGSHYPDCAGENKISFGSTCTIPEGAKLLIHNFRDDKSKSYKVDITIIDLNERSWPDMTWRSEDLQYSDELFQYIGSFTS